MPAVLAMNGLPQSGQSRRYLPSLKDKTPTEKETEIPDVEIKALARCFLPFIRAFFDSEDGQREFAEWQKEQAKIEKQMFEIC
jgi:hypothetical protein